MAVPRGAARSLTGRLGAARSLTGRLGAALLLALSGAAACDGEGRDAGVLADSTYVEVMARLSLVRERAPVLDSATADSARVAILGEHGVAREDLEGYARRHAEDVEHMRRIWEAIAERMDTLAASADPRRGLDLPEPGEEGPGRRPDSAADTTGPGRR